MTMFWMLALGGSIATLLTADAKMLAEWHAREHYHVTIQRVVALFILPLALWQLWKLWMS